MFDKYLARFVNTSVSVCWKKFNTKLFTEIWYEFFKYCIQFRITVNTVRKRALLIFCELAFFFELEHVLSQTLTLVSWYSA